MISILHIKNVGIIDDVTIDLNSGLNILTGETGAGKTLIIDSLQIISGGRFSKEMIRKGQEFSYVEASMYLPKNIEALDRKHCCIKRNIYKRKKYLQNKWKTCISRRIKKLYERNNRHTRTTRKPVITR